jgi:hypothetical protein
MHALGPIEFCTLSMHPRDENRSSRRGGRLGNMKRRTLIAVPGLPIATVGTVDPMAIFNRGSAAMEVPLPNAR